MIIHIYTYIYLHIDKYFTIQRSTQIKNIYDGEELQNDSTDDVAYVFNRINILERKNFYRININNLVKI